MPSPCLVKRAERRMEQMESRTAGDALAAADGTGTESDAGEGRGAASPVAEHAALDDGADWLPVPDHRLCAGVALADVDGLDLPAFAAGDGVDSRKPPPPHVERAFVEVYYSLHGYGVLYQMACSRATRLHPVWQTRRHVARRGVDLV